MYISVRTTLPPYLDPFLGDHCCKNSFSFTFVASRYIFKFNNAISVDDAKTMIKHADVKFGNQINGKDQQEIKQGRHLLIPFSEN